MAETYDGTEGNDALAAGYPVMDGTEDWRDGWRAVNRARDLVARLKTWTTTQINAVNARIDSISFSWSAITGKPTEFPPASHTHSAISEAGGKYLRWDGAKWDSNAPMRVGSNLDVSGGVAVAGDIYIPNATPVNQGTWYALYRNGDGRIGLTPSARKYKKYIKAYEGSVLGIQPVTYALRGDAENTRHLGIIADDARDIEPLLVISEDGEVESFRYELLAVALLADVRRLAARIDELERRTDAPTS